MKNKTIQGSFQTNSGNGRNRAWSTNRTPGNV